MRGAWEYACPLPLAAAGGIAWPWPPTTTTTVRLRAWDSRVQGALPFVNVMGGLGGRVAES
jgi:hypothetical protein